MASGVVSFGLIRGLVRNGILRGRCHPVYQLASRSLHMHTPEPFHPIPNRMPVKLTPEDAVSVIKSGMRVYVHGCASTPLVLLEAMANHGKKACLKDVEVIHIHTEGPALHTKPEYKGIFRDNSLFIGSNCRQAVNDGLADFIPIFLVEVPLLFRRNILNLDVAMVQLSPPDRHGFCSLGTSIDCTRAALQNAKHIIGQINKNQPRTFGDGIIHMSHLDSYIEATYPLPEAKKAKVTEVEDKIATLIAENLVLDDATLQMGIGSIPNAVLEKLTKHRDLGIHSEMFSDGILPLIECGAITNAKKAIHTGKVVGGFAFGTKTLYDFMDNNPFIEMLDITFVNQAAIIAQNPKVTAINSCLEIDLTGQVAADSIGTKFYSGIGGQVDFMRGAAIAFDGLGKPILAMPSVTNKKESKIVPFLKHGAGVVSTRAHVHYFVTEYGIAYLFGKNIRQRAYELIKIAHPDHRESLEKAAFERMKCMPSP